MVLSSVCICPFASEWFSWPLQVSSSTSTLPRAAPGSAWFSHQSHCSLSLGLHPPAQNTVPHVCHNQIQLDETQHLSNQMVFQSLLQTLRSFYQDPHMLCSLPSCKNGGFLGICRVLNTLPVSRLADAHDHRLMKEKQGPGGWKVVLGFHLTVLCN